MKKVKKNLKVTGETMDALMAMMKEQVSSVLVRVFTREPAEHSCVEAVYFCHVGFVLFFLFF